jgi:hypothetical protein
VSTREGLELLHDEVLTSFEHSDRRSDILEQNLTSQLQYVSSDLRIGHGNITQRLDGQTRQIEDVHNTVVSNYEHNRNSSVDIEAMLHRMKDMESQSDENVALLKNIVDILQNMNLHNEKNQPVINGESSTTKQRELPYGSGRSCTCAQYLTDDLEQSINRLCRQMPIKEPGSSQMESKLILVDLKRIVGFLLNRISSPDTENLTLCDYHRGIQESYQDIMRRMKVRLNATTRVFINSTGTAPHHLLNVIF